MNEGTFSSKKLNKSKGYANGAIVGLIAGVLAGMYFKKKLWMFGAIGAVAGGYIGYMIAEAMDEKVVFNFKNPEEEKK